MHNSSCFSDGKDVDSDGEEIDETCMDTNNNNDNETDVKKILCVKDMNRETDVACDPSMCKEMLGSNDHLNKGEIKEQE